MKRPARPTLLAACLATCVSFSAHRSCGQPIEILPKRFQLYGSEATQPLLVERVSGDRFVGSAGRLVEWKTSDFKVVDVYSGIATPVGNGRATISARVRNETATAEVTVAGMETPHQWDFSRHVVPILSKIGCNSGACHGALAGKGGFKLSLRGYDPLGDFFTITQQSRGRRIEFSDPGRSLVLAKPSGALSHKGGLRLDPKSRDYEIFAQWISAGAQPPRVDEPVLEELVVLPRSVTLPAGGEQRLLVRAVYSDGREEDVTHWAKFSSTDETVASVDDRGKVTVMGSGEGAISAWFSSRIVLSRITVPFDNQIDANVFAAAPGSNFIDELVNGKLQELHLAPSPLATDTEYLRRVYLDTIGTLPTIREVEVFLDDPAPCKREHLVDELLERPEYVDYWTYRWSDMFLINGKRLRPPAVKAYYQWLRGHVQRNTRWDQIVREVVTATGSSYENGATNFYALHQSPEEMAENLCQAFLGLSIGCAKCHNHPLEKWTNNQYYAMANLFARVRAKGWGGDGRGGDGLRTLYLVGSGELVQPLTGRPQPPTPLDGESLAFDDPRDRRVHLADWLTSPDNPYFSRSIANRVWYNFFGVGLVESVDDMRASNPSSNEALLDALADFLIEQDFDLKVLMRQILLSETYQRSSVPLPENEADRRFYSRYYPRRLMAEVLLDAISQVTEVSSEFNKIAHDGADFEDTKEYKPGTRAIQLYDSAVFSKFLATFGRNKRDIVCECERSNKPSMVQVLHINNGETINQKLRAENSCVAKSLSTADQPEKLITSAYLRTVSRRPTEAELAGIQKILAEAEGDELRRAIEDLYWSLLSSREFVFNH